MKFLTQLLARPLFAVAAGLSLIAVPALALANEGASGSAKASFMWRVPPPTAQAVEVVLGSGGQALVRGAHVTTVSGSTVTATTGWGSAVLTWTVHTDSTTNVVDQDDDSATTTSPVAVGDLISFSGSIDQSASAFTVNANVLRDWSKLMVATTTSTTTPPARPIRPMPEGFLNGFLNFWANLSVKAHLFGNH